LGGAGQAIGRGLPGNACQGGNYQEYQVILEVVHCGGVGKLGLYKAEHDTQVVQAVSQAFVVEEHPADQNQNQGDNQVDHTGKLVFDLFEQEFFSQKQQTVVHTPGHEVPAGTVPEAGQQPDDEDVADIFPEADPVAAQGNIHIIPEEAAQGNVPPAPEFCNAFGDVGVVEVFQELKAEDPAHTDGHIGIAAEIEVDLEGICHSHQPAACKGQCAIGQFIHHHTTGVGQKNLFGKADEEPHIAPVNILGAVTALIQACGNIGIVDDGTGDQLGEEADIQQKVQKALLHAHFAAVHIYGIGQHLEGVEGDTNGQHRLEEGIFGTQQGCEDIGEEAEIFKVEQKQQAHTNTQHHVECADCLLLTAVDQNAAAVVDGNRQQHHKDPLGLTPGIEQQGEHQKDDVACLQFWAGVIQQIHQR